MSDKRSKDLEAGSLHAYELASKTFSVPAPRTSGEAANRKRICRSLAFRASNYYDALYLRTGSTAADNPTELAAIFEAEWMTKYGEGPLSPPPVESPKEEKE